MVFLLVVCGLTCLGIAGGMVRQVAEGGPDVTAAWSVMIPMACVGLLFLCIARYVAKRR